MIIEKARELGLALSESEEFRQMLRARAAFDADEIVSGKFNEYNAKQEEIVSLLEQSDADSSRVSAMSDDLERLQKELLGDPVFSGLISAQNDFQQLMQRVNKTIGACIGMEEEEEEESGCSGNCASCHSCHH